MELRYPCKKCIVRVNCSSCCNSWFKYWESRSKLVDFLASIALYVSFAIIIKEFF